MSKKRAADGEDVAERDFMQSWLSHKPHRARPSRCYKGTRSHELEDGYTDITLPPLTKKARGRQDSAMAEGPSTTASQPSTSPTEPATTPTRATRPVHAPRRQPSQQGDASPLSDPNTPAPTQPDTLAPPQLTALTLTAPPPLTLHLHPRRGDIFAAPPSTLLIHACNTMGSWGAGIAAAFRSRYPAAYARHREHCSAHSPAALVGTAQLLAPCEPSGPAHWIGCVFTSRRYGRAKDGPEEILRATGAAVRELLRLVREAAERGGVVGEARMCRINSGSFGVPWERTKAVLEGVEVGEGGVREIVVFEM